MIIKKREYNLLVEEIKATITEAVYNSRWALIEGYWNIGKLIRKEFGSGELTKLLTGLSVDVGLSERTLWRALACYDKYPQLNDIPEGKNISWNKLIIKYLSSGKEKERQTQNFQQEIKCPYCKKMFIFNKLI